jgi:hypothetical protein
LSRSERITLGILAVAALVLRAVAFFRYRFDSDEPQHLHVAWGWTAGSLPYRDIFDNHAPLFHMLTAPVMALVGERADGPLLMRAPMLVFFAMVIWCTYELGRRLWSPAIGARAAVLLIFFPPFFLKSLEYRNDNLWNALWMMALVAAPHPFLSGLLLGAALATSMKTSLLILCVVLAAIAVSWPIDKRSLVLAAAGFTVVPAAVIAYFAWRGALQSMTYCIITFNGLAGETRASLWAPRLIVPVVAIGLAVYLRRRFALPFLAWIAFTYTALTASYWILPLVSPRDFLTMMPILAILGAVAMERLRRRAPALIAIGVVFAGSLVYYTDRFENRTDETVTMLDQLLGLTRPGEHVVDYKGELIYRPRASYYALETITRDLMARGIIKDTIAEDVVRSRSYVAQADGDFWPARGRAFLLANFINLGRLRAAGQWIADDGSFSIAIPGEYVIVNERGIAAGTLDGTAQARPVALASGPHRFDRANPGERVAVLWAPALDRGYSPFHLRDLDF